MPEVLVVDDDPDYGPLLNRYLSKKGFQVRSVLTADEALALCEHGPKPDLVILDWCLPRGLPGEKALELFKSREDIKRIPLVVVTGADLNEQERRHIRAAGADLFLAKGETSLNLKAAGSLAEKLTGLLLSSSKIVKNILLVEDDEGTAEYLKDCLQRAGYAVTVATRGAAALDYLSKTVKPSVVLLDCTLPDADGLKLCKSIKGVPVIILTSLSENRARLRAQEAGARLFLNKPVSSEDLLGAVAQVLGQVDSEKRQAASSAGALVVNESACTISYGKKTTRLAGRPLRLFLLLAGEHPATVERRRLAERLNPDDRDREVDVLVSLIRRQCRRELDVNPIETIAGVGYRLILPVQLS